MTVPEAVPAEGAPERAPAATTPAAGTEPAARTLPAAATLPPAGRVVLTGTLPQGGPAGEAPPVATAGETAGREPALPLFVYDGDCGFCTASASWIGRRLRVPVRVAPWQSLDLAALGLVEADVTSAAYWIDEAGSRHRGAAGVARALGGCGGGWAAAGRVLRVPPFSWLGAAVYRLVAANRHRLPGATAACRLPPR